MGVDVTYKSLLSDFLYVLNVLKVAVSSAAAKQLSSGITAEIKRLRQIQIAPSRGRNVTDVTHH